MPESLNSNETIHCQSLVTAVMSENSSRFAACWRRVLDPVGPFPIPSEIAKANSKSEHNAILADRVPTTL